MAENMNEIIKQIAVAAIEEAKPLTLLYGVVTNVNPLEITVDQRLKLTKDFLVLCEAVCDHVVYMSVDHITEQISLNANHEHEAETVFNGNIITEITNETEPKTTKVTSTAESKINGSINTTVKPAAVSLSHAHHYSGKKKFHVHSGLKQGEKVILMRFQGGQRFLVLDRAVVS